MRRGESKLVRYSMAYRQEPVHCAGPDWLPQAGDLKGPGSLQRPEHRSPAAATLGLWQPGSGSDLKGPGLPFKALPEPWHRGGDLKGPELCCSSGGQSPGPFKSPQAPGPLNLDLNAPPLPVEATPPLRTLAYR
ncbi:hypothetical protein UY3_07151 [Chelonia mydas]|uniref:Uncharacterized protein n=1 Tax=Chelonia mydas TaxID=8469 RepID=M7BJ10_CHEMY|nr:hypothetical protein UY3_07151 [Chelonia mydas]